MVALLGEVFNRSTAEWILWLDSDLVIMDLGLELPFRDIPPDKDWVVYGSHEMVLAGDAINGGAAKVA